MHQKADLIRNFEELGIRRDGTLLVHSSMRAVGPVEGGAATVIEAFSAYLAPGLLVLPTHTWDRVTAEQPIYDPVQTASCVGILGELFRKMPEVCRSLHPTHSLAACGVEAKAFVADEELRQTPCPREGCYGKFYDRSAQVLFLGCSLKRNTLLHGVEEWCGIPNRLTDSREELRIRMPDGNLIPCPMHRHSDEHGDISAQYDKIEELLFAAGIARRGRIGDAQSVLCEVRPMVNLVSKLLKIDPDLFIDERPLPAL